MDPNVTVLHEQGRGPVTIDLTDGSEYEVELRETTIEGNTFHAEGTDRNVDDVLYRVEEDFHDGDELTLERRHARDDEWTALGTIGQVTKDS